MNKFQTLVVDPPWQFRRQPRRVRPTYELLGLDAIKTIPIPDMAAENAHLYLWVCNAFLGEGLDVMGAWGFQYKTAITWAKHQMGIGNFYRNATEHILFGVKGRLPILRHDLRTWFLADRRQHSRKPDEFYRLVESASPGPRIDVFSREKREGWAQWGNQCDFFNGTKLEVQANEGEAVVDGGGSGEIARCGDLDGIRVDQSPEDSVPESGEPAAIRLRGDH